MKSRKEIIKEIVRLLESAPMEVLVFILTYMQR